MSAGEQLSLLPAPTPAPTATGRGGYLAGLHQLYTTLVATGPFRAAVRDALTVVAGDRRRTAGEAFEDALAVALAPRAAELSAAVLAALPGGRLRGFASPLTAVSLVHDTSERAGHDFTLHAAFDGPVLTVPVNVKLVDAADGAAGRWDDACNLPTLLQVAQPGRTDAGAPVDRQVLEWHAGRRRIGRADYVLVVVNADKGTGTLRAVSAQGLLSSVDDAGRLAVRRSKTRRTVLYHHAALPLPDSLDVNAALVSALTPAADGDELRLRLLAFLSAPGADTAALAERLLGLPDAALRAALVRALAAA